MQTRRFHVLLGSQFAEGGVNLADIAPVEADGGVGGVTGPVGPDGWSPVLASESDGARRVHRVVDWVGGEGSKPEIPSLNYIGASGFTNLAAAVDMRGVQGLQGDDGWEAVLAIEVDGARRVLKVVDWVGGGGTKPGVPSPAYIGAAGFTNLAGAVDIRGPQGAQGDVGEVGVIEDGSVTNAKLAFVAQGTFKARSSTGSGALEDLTSTQAKTLLAIDAADVAGLAEAAQDAVGSALTDSATVDFSYDDTANTLAASVKDGSLGVEKLSFDPATQAELNGHIDEVSAAHAAEAIAYSGLLSAESVAGALDALTVTKAEVDAVSEVASDLGDLDALVATKAPLASPALSGTPTAPTATAGTNTTQIASTAFVAAAVAALINSAPGVLDTLDEIAAALGDDPDFAATITTALAGKQPLDSDLTAIAALTTSTFGRALLELADAAAARAALELGTAATQASTAFEAAGAAAAAQAASQPLDADLTAVAGLSPSNDDVLQRKSGAWTNRTPAQVKTDLALAKGDVGLGNVDNTSDANKPISTATQTALDLKQPLDSDLTAIAALTTTSFGRGLLALADAAAGLTAFGAAPLASPAFTGTPTAPTQSLADNSTKLATTAMVQAALASFGDTFAFYAPLASPALTGNPTAPTQTAGTNNTRIATTAYADAGLVANAQSGTTYTLVLTDQNKVVECTNASAITVTVPTTASVAFPVGTVLTVYQGGAGQVTLAGAGGVTLRNDLKTPGQYKEIGLRKRATDEWVVIGGVA
jgi:hypothetical protein